MRKKARFMISLKNSTKSINRTSRVLGNVPSGVYSGTLERVLHDEERQRVVFTWRVQGGGTLTRDCNATTTHHGKLLEVVSSILAPDPVPLDSLQSILKAISKAHGRPYYLAYTQDPERRGVGGSLAIVPAIEAQEAIR
jgi:hypothetical protein